MSRFVTSRLFFLCFFSAVCGLQSSVSFAQEWKEEKGDHFIVYFMSDAAKPRDILRKAEHSYLKVAHDLGYSRYSNFWQWDNRTKIYVHATKESFQQATGQPAWSDGMASYLDKSIHTIEGTENFLDGILPHEITHLIFRDFVGLRSQVPLWLDEGVAQWEEEDKRALALQWMPSLARKAALYSVRQLTSTDIRHETDADKVHIFYLEAISIVDYLIGTYGSSRFTDFCRELRDGKSFEDSLHSAYAPMLKDLEQLETLWLDGLFAQAHAAALMGS